MIKKITITLFLFLHLITVSACSSTEIPPTEEPLPTEQNDGIEYITTEPMVSEYIELEYIDLEYVNLIEAEFEEVLQKYPDYEYVDRIEVSFISSSEFTTYLDEPDVQDFTSQFVDWNKVKNDLAIGGTLLVINFTINSIRFGSPINAAIYLFKDIAIGIAFDFIFDAIPKILNGVDPYKATIEAIAEGFKYGMIFELAATGVASIFHHIQAVRIAAKYADSIPGLEPKHIFSLSKNISNKARLIQEVGEETAEALMKNTDIMIKAVKLAPTPIRVPKMKSIIGDYALTQLPEHTLEPSLIRGVLTELLNGKTFQQMYDNSTISKAAVDFVVQNQGKLLSRIRSFVQQHQIQSYVSRTLKTTYETYLETTLGKDLAEKITKGTLRIVDYDLLLQSQKDQIIEALSNNVTSNKHILGLMKQIKLNDFSKLDAVAPYADDLMLCATQARSACSVSTLKNFIDMLNNNLNLSEQFLKNIDDVYLRKQFLSVSEEVIKNNFKQALGDPNVAEIVFKSLKDRKTADAIVKLLKNTYPDNVVANQVVSYLLGEGSNSTMHNVILNAIRYSNINNQYLLDLLQQTASKTNFISLLKFYGNKITRGNILTLLSNPSVDNVQSILTKINNSQEIAIEQFGRLLNSIDFGDLSLTRTQLDNLAFLKFDSILRTRYRSFDYTSSMISRADYNRIINVLKNSNSTIDSLRNLNISVYGENIVDIMVTQRDSILMLSQNLTIEMSQPLLKDFVNEFLQKEVLRATGLRLNRAQLLIDNQILDKIMNGTLFQTEMTNDLIKAIVEFYPEILPVVSKGNQLVFEEFTEKMVYYRGLDILQRFKNIDGQLKAFDRSKFTQEQLMVIDDIISKIALFKTNTTKNITTSRFATLAKYEIDEYSDMYVEIAFEGTSYFFPNFDRFTKYIAQPNKVFDRAQDFLSSNAISKLPQTPYGYVWHHIEDGRNLILIPSDIHSLLSHTGGFSIANIFNLFEELMQIGIQ